MEDIRIDEQFRSILDNLVEGVQILDFDWKYIYVNDALVGYSSYSREELLGHTIMDKYPGIEQTTVFKSLEKCMNERTFEKVESEFTFPDGSVSYFDLSIQPVKEGIFIHSVNRTLQRKATYKLEKVNRLYAFTSAINQSIVHINDAQKLLENACNIAIEIGGFKMAWVDLIDSKSGKLQRHSQLSIDAAKNTKNITTPTNDPLVKIVFNTGNYALSNNIENDPIMESRKDELIAEGIHAKIELPIKENGKVIGAFGLYASQKNFFDEEEIVLLQEAVGDISFALEVFEKNRRHQETEALLLANEIRFRALIEKSVDMKTLATADGKLIYASPSVTKVLGYTLEAFIHRPVNDFIHPEDLGKFQKDRNLLIQNKLGSINFEIRCKHKDGHWLWCEGTLTNMLHVAGVEAIVSNFTDVSIKKIAEERKAFDAKNTEALINNTHDLIWSVDKNFCLISANRSFNAIMEQLRGKPILQGEKLLEGNNSAEDKLYKAFYSRALKGETFSETSVLLLPEKRWSEISFFPIRNGDEIIGTACHSRDITAFKNLEIDLQKKLQEISDYKYALDESSIVAITDQKGVIRHVNDNFCTISKYSREELIGQDHRIINSGYHSKEFIKKIWTTIANGKIWKGELKNKAKDGTYYWVDTTIVPFLDDNQKPYQYIAIRSDITQRKAVQDQLRKSEEFSREVLNSLSAHIAVIDAIGDIVTVNDAWKNFGIENGMKSFNRSGDENNYFKVCEKSLAEGDTSAGEILFGLKEVLAKRLQNYYYEYACHAPHEERWFAMTTRPFQGEESMLVIAHNDISQRKLAEEKLVHKNKELEKINFELDRFVYSVSHDLRSPLSAILGLLSFIEDESHEPDTLAHAKMIRTRIFRLDEFIKNILNYSRNNRIEADITYIDVESILNETIEALCNAKDADTIKFELQVAGKEHFYSDKQSFITIVENLISNAIKFHDKEKEHQQISIQASINATELALTISDNGVGIAKEHHDRIFDMFFRLSGKVSGSGIGLYIVKEIIGKLMGSIKVDSQIGEGTVFTITLKNFKP